MSQLVLQQRMKCVRELFSWCGRIRWALAIPLLVGLVQACSSVPPLPESPDAGQLLREADLARIEGQFLSAGRLFDRAAEAARLQGSSDLGTQALVSAGECYLAGGETSGAWRALSQARAELEGRTRAAWYPVAWLKTCTGLGDLDLKAGRLDNAWLHYQEALSVAQSDARDAVLYRLTVTAERQGRTSEAEQLRVRILRPQAIEIQSLARALGANLPSLPHAQTLPVAAPVGSGPALHYLARSQWSARPSRRNFDPMGRPYRITVHHTGEYFSTTSQRETSSMLQKIQKHHQDNNGWADIGYHFLIDPSGRIWQGRQASHQGAHAGSPSLNRGNLGIALMGNFSEQRLTTAQQRALVGLLASLMTELRIPAERVYSHQDVPGRLAATECPGSALQRAMPSILGEVRTRLAQLRTSGGGSLLATRPN